MNVCTIPCYEYKSSIKITSIIFLYFYNANTRVGSEFE